MIINLPRFPPALITSIILFALLPLWSVSQHVVPVRNIISGTWHLGINIGAAIPFIDITEPGLLPKSGQKPNGIKPSSAIFLGFEINPIFELRGEALIASLSDQSQSRNQYFTATSTELNAIVLYSFLNHLFPTISSKNVHVRLFGGSGLSFYHSGVYNLLTDETLVERGGNRGFGFDKKLIEGIIITGLSVDIRLTGNIKLLLATGQRWMNADNFDSVIAGFPFDSYNITSLGIKIALSNERPYPVVFEDYRSVVK
jgi:hypothetical protein